MAYRLMARPDPRAANVRTSRGHFAPSRIEADVELPGSGIRVRFLVRVDPGGAPRVIELAVWAAEGAAGAITSRALRGIQLDRLARDAVRQWERPVTERPDIAPGAYSWPGAPEGTFMAEPPPRRLRLTPAEKISEAARVYREALAGGSRSPTEAAAAALNVSRSQASRYVRQARDAGMLPPPPGRRAGQPPTGRQDA
jgi:hypothetical protein